MIPIPTLSPLNPTALFFAESIFKDMLFPLIWFGILILTLVVESQTADLVAIWFAPGAFVAMILGFVKVDFWIQFGVFVAVAAIGLILSFSVIRPAMKKRNVVLKTNTDSLAGKFALVVEDIDNAAAAGAVKVNGQLWTARMLDPTVKVAKDEWVEILRVEGSKLICIPKH